MPEVIYKLGEELGIDRRALSSVVRHLGRGMSEVMSSPAHPSHELKVDKRRRGSLDFYVQPVKQ